MDRHGPPDKRSHYIADTLIHRNLGDTLLFCQCLFSYLSISLDIWFRLLLSVDCWMMSVWAARTRSDSTEIVRNAYVWIFCWVVVVVVHRNVAHSVSTKTNWSRAWFWQTNNVLQMFPIGVEWFNLMYVCVWFGSSEEKRKNNNTIEI